MIKCPKCGSARIFKAGFKFDLESYQQRYQCRKCGNSFWINSTEEEIANAGKTNGNDNDRGTTTADPISESDATGNY